MLLQLCQSRNEHQWPDALICAQLHFLPDEMAEGQKPMPGNQAGQRTAAVLLN